VRQAVQQQAVEHHRHRAAVALGIGRPEAARDRRAHVPELRRRARHPLGLGQLPDALQLELEARQVQRRVLVLPSGERGGDRVEVERLTDLELGLDPDGDRSGVLL
jgi:hypothetical protein